jgi:hypothetical protein
MSYWRGNAKSGRWREINHLHPSKKDQRVLLAMLEEAVPMKEIKNGMERTSRHALPNEVTGPDLKYAAMVLHLGELKASVDGEPPTPTTQWSEMQEQARRFLEQALDESEYTTGDAELSRNAHLERARECLDEIADLTKFCTGMAVSKAEAERMRHAMAEAAINAFSLGRHAQASLGKLFEQLAAAQEKVLLDRSGAREGHNARRRSVALKWNETARSIASKLWANKPSASASQIAKSVRKEIEAQTANIRAAYEKDPAEVAHLKGQQIAAYVQDELLEGGLVNAIGETPAVDGIRRAISSLKPSGK